jgi:hypothetical protein
MRRTVKIALAMLVCGWWSYGQWIGYPAPGIPRTPDGKPDLLASAPRAAGGKPDLSGLWIVEPSPLPELRSLFPDFKAVEALTVPGDDISAVSKYAINILADFKPDEIPMRPEAEARFRATLAKGGSANPTTRCLPGGLPFIYLFPIPSKFIQTPGFIAILHEAGFNFRQIYIDGRTRPSDPEPLWYGYSTGRWDGDTLVVTSTGFNDKSWLDALGHPHSDALHLTELYHRRDFGHLDVQVTIDDPKMYSKAFTIKYTERLVPDSDLLEYVCEENEKDVQHIAKP